MAGHEGKVFGLDRVPIPENPEHERDVIRHLITREAGTIHLVGAGGVGMAGLGRLLKEQGLAVTGCDGSM